MDRSALSWIFQVTSTLVSQLNNLFPQSPPIGRPNIATGAGARRESDDLVDLAARDLHFYGGIQEIGRIHDQPERFTCGEDRPHAGESKACFISWNRHGVEPALVKMFHRHMD